MAYAAVPTIPVHAADLELVVAGKIGRIIVWIRRVRQERIAGKERLFGRSPVLEGVFDRRSIVRHDIQKITGRHQGDSTQKRYKVSIMFHGRFLLKIQIQAKIENPLKRISETVSGHFRVPHLKVGQDEQVGRMK